MRLPLEAGGKTSRTVRKGSARQDLAQDRLFWRRVLDRWTETRGLPAHSAGGYRNRRFVIVRGAAWITLYRAMFPFPQIGVFLRCTGFAGEAFLTLADQARLDLEPRLRSEPGPDATFQWGTTYHPGMIDIAAILPAAAPWNGDADDQQIAWLVRVGAVWWRGFASLA